MEKVTKKMIYSIKHEIDTQFENGGYPITIDFFLAHKVDVLHYTNPLTGEKIDFQIEKDIIGPTELCIKKNGFISSVDIKTFNKHLFYVLYLDYGGEVVNHHVDMKNNDVHIELDDGTIFTLNE